MFIEKEKKSSISDFFSYVKIVKNVVF